MTAESVLDRRSPLSAYAGRFAASALDLVEEPYATQLLLRLDPTRPVVLAVEDVLGMALPVALRASNPAGPRTVSWLGPDEWLVTHTSPEPGPTTPEPGPTTPEPGPTTPEPVEGRASTRSANVPSLETTLAALLHPAGGAVVDVSAQRTTIRLRGAHARQVLAKGSSVDLHPRVVRPGLAVQTMVAHAGVVLIVLDPGAVEQGQSAELDCRLLVRSTFAGHLADWLLDAALEYSTSF